MSYLVWLVIDDLDKCNDVLQAWEDAGTRGITILESTGIGRIRKGIRDDIPLMPSLTDLLKRPETHHRTIFSVVKEEEDVNKLHEATKSVIGDLDEPNTGVMFVIQLHSVYGINKRKRE